MRKIHAGCYTTKTGWTIERSAIGGWNIITPEGGLIDCLPTKKQAMEIYG